MDTSCYFLKFDPEKHMNSIEHMDEYNCKCDFVLDLGKEKDYNFYKNKCGCGKCKFYIKDDYQVIKNLLTNQLLDQFKNS